MAGSFIVKTEEDTLVCTARGKIKKNGEIFVGDQVEVTDNVIESVYPRKNVLIRPYVANIDVLFIVIAPVPEPDWVLVEKLLLNCRQEGIPVAIIYNKCDLGKEDEIKGLLTPYRRDADTFVVSTKKKIGMDELAAYIVGKTVCFAGQSAVGKTSLVATLGGKRLEVGELSKRIARGKNTTRAVEIYDFAGGRLVDTCGFSVAESIDIKPEELIYYYEDFLKVQNECKFSNCRHINEPGCAVKKMLEEGSFDKDRYTRYVKLYNELTERRKKLYV